MDNILVGREKEISKLRDVLDSTQAEFLAVYGRRRVGKTYLIREFFLKKPGIFFQATGSRKGSLKKQLANFIQLVSETFLDGLELKVPVSWEEALKVLNKQLIKVDEKVVVFIDELPWMATRRSGLLEAIDYYWNQYWSRMPNLVFIVCGSSASWLIKKIIQFTIPINLPAFPLIRFPIREYRLSWQF